MKPYRRFISRSRCWPSLAPNCPADQLYTRKALSRHSLQNRFCVIPCSYYGRLGVGSDMSCRYPSTCVDSVFMGVGLRCVIDEFINNLPQYRLQRFYASILAPAIISQHCTHWCSGNPMTMPLRGEASILHSYIAVPRNPTTEELHPLFSTIFSLSPTSPLSSTSRLVFQPITAR